ncbi:hypothetical protein [Paenibacillus sp. NRS-1781]|uniref:hypothetical protein n=1 Tax=Paenibacillus sp. NRS-1781 TaxID=3233905 RepID=UPI003D2D2AD3
MKKNFHSHLEVPIMHLSCGVKVLFFPFPISSQQKLRTNGESSYKITKSITELHNGSISVRSSRRQMDFETRFPLYHARQPINNV